MAENTDTPRWERIDALEEQARFSLRTRVNERRGMLLLFVTKYPDTWKWTTLHVTVSDDAGRVAQGTTTTRDYARQLAERAAELRLEDLRSQGIPRREPG